MLKEKRMDLDSEKQKQLVGRLVTELSQTSSDLYYQPTSEISREIKRAIDAGDSLRVEEQALLKGLSERDIAVLLSLN